MSYQIRRKPLPGIAGSHQVANPGFLQVPRGAAGELPSIHIQQFDASPGRGADRSSSEHDQRTDLNALHPHHEIENEPATKLVPEHEYHNPQTGQIASDNSKDQAHVAKNQVDSVIEVQPGKYHHIPSHFASLNPSIPKDQNKTETTSSTYGYAYYKPIWLRTWVLILLAALFTLLWIGLVILYRYSRKGIDMTLSQNHYAWTYGPTAILVVVLSLWRQVDYQCKAMQPWQEMSMRPSDSVKSLLLDYLWPLLPESFYAAVKNRHLAVLASIVGFLILKLVTLLSTGLLASLPTPIAQRIPVVITNGFDGSAMWASAQTRIRPANTSGYGLNGDFTEGSFLNISTVPMTIYTSVLNGTISQPAGTNDMLAYPSLDLEHYSPETISVSAEVEAFVPNITCEIARVGTFPDNADNSSALYYTLDSPSCSVGHRYIRLPSGQMVNETQLRIPQTFCSGNYCNASALGHTISRVNCSGTGDASSVLLTAATPNTYGYVIMAYNMSYTKVLDETQSPDNLSHWNTSLNRAAAVVCKIGYNIKNATLKYDTSNATNPTIELVTKSAGRKLPDLTDLVLMELLFSSLYLSGSTYAGTLGTDGGPPNPDRMWSMMNRIKNLTVFGDTWLDPNMLQSAATTAFRGMAVQFFRSQYMNNTRIDSFGLGENEVHKIFVRPVPLWVMVFGCISLSVLPFVIILGFRGFSMPHNPSSIAALALVLLSSPMLSGILRNTGHLSLKDLRKRLDGFKFETRLATCFQIVTSGVASEKSTKTKAKHQNFVPYSGRRHAICLTFLSPLAAIIVLEVLYQLSQKRNGLVDVENDNSSKSYATRYGSTAIAFLIATLFNGLDFAIASLAPFSALRSQNTTARRGILFHVLGSTPLKALYDSIRNGHFGVASSNCAALVGSVLTVIVSGLWIVDSTVSVSTNVTMPLNHTWNWQWPDNLYVDRGASAKLDLIQHGGDEYPKSIWQDLVLPNINTPSSASSEANYTFVVPALRPRLVCDFVSDDEYGITYDRSDPQVYRTYLNAYIKLPKGCLSGPYANESTAAYAATFFYFDDTYAGYVGNFDDIHMGPWNASDTYQKSYGDYAYQDLQPNNPAGCPSIAAIFGYFDNWYTAKRDITLLFCSQKVQLVPTKVTFIGNPSKQQISTDQPPVPDEKNAIFLTNGTTGIDSFGYRTSRYWFYNITNVSPNAVPVQDGERRMFFGAFWDHLVFGPGGHPYSEIYARHKRDNLLKAVQDLYNKYMVLAIDMNFRQPTHGTVSTKSEGRRSVAAEQPIQNGYQSVQTTVTGTQLDPTIRLRVSYGAKFTLQIMLGSMVVFAAIAYLLVNLRGTVAHPPTSIAGTMSLLAGSELCSESGTVLPINTPRLDRKTLLRTLDGWIFSLGWWQHRNQAASSEENSHVQSAAGSSNSQIEERQGEGDGLVIEPATEWFGIDVGTAARSGLGEKGGRKRKSWKLMKAVGGKSAGVNEKAIVTVHEV